MSELLSQDEIDVLIAQLFQEMEQAKEEQQSA
jgi:flagellar motor switch protein FliM